MAPGVSDQPKSSARRTHQLTEEAAATRLHRELRNAIPCAAISLCLDGHLEEVATDRVAAFVPTSARCCRSSVVTIPFRSDSSKATSTIHLAQLAARSGYVTEDGEIRSGRR